MFEAVELRREVSPEEYDRRAPALREALLEAQVRLAECRSSVLVLLAGVDGAGKGETVNLLNTWLDPHLIDNRSFDDPTQEERERPEGWRYWRALPAYGRIGCFLSAWYSAPLLRFVDGSHGERELLAALDRIAAGERMLADNGIALLKIWLHLDREAQVERFRAFEADPLQRWRVTPRDWEHVARYDHFMTAAEHILTRSHSPAAPWKVVEGWDSRARGLEVGETLLDTLGRVTAAPPEERAPDEAKGKNGAQPARAKGKNGARPAGAKGKSRSQRAEAPLTVLSKLDLSLSLTGSEYRERRDQAHAALAPLQRRAREQGVASVLVFEGWDAAGKGGVIRRVTEALDVRRVQVHRIAAPTDEERAHPYLWRFWRRIPRDGEMAIFDRSWYGRVLVERVEKLAPPEAWERAFSEINAFEALLQEHGCVLLKFLLHIDAEEQLARFKEREKTPHKRHKISEADYRNRELRDEYELAFHEVIERTSTPGAPWSLVAANDKRWARVCVLEHLVQALEEGLS